MDAILTGRALLFLLVLLALDAWAIGKTFAGEAATVRKWVWTIVILLLPLLGLAIWSIAGPRISKPEIYEHEPP